MSVPVLHDDLSRESGDRRYRPAGAVPAWSPSRAKGRQDRPVGARSIFAGSAILLAALALAVSLLRPAEPQPIQVRPAPSAAPHGGIQPLSARAAFAGSAKATPIDTTIISDRLAADLTGLHGHYGVEVVDLASGRVYGYHGQQSFQAASVNKLPILVALYERAQTGRLSLSQSLTLSDADIQRYGTGTLQNPGSPRVYTLADLAGLMIKVSDNTAAYVLERFLGQASVQQDLLRWGITHTSMAANTSTPADAAALVAAIYADRLLAPSASQAALALLQQTVFDDRLAAGMPAGVPVGHKIGTDVGIFNDAGIVLLPGRPYAVAVFSEDTTESEADAAYARLNADILGFQRSLPSLRTP